MESSRLSSGWAAVSVSCVPSHRTGGKLPRSLWCVLPALLLLLAVTGCEKVPTFQELTGQDSGEETPTAPATSTDGSPAAQNGSGGTSPLARQPVEPPSPEKILEAFHKDSHRATDAQVQKLVEDLGENVEVVDELSLAGSSVSDAGMEWVGKLTGLKSLNLANVSLTPAGYGHLRAIPGLEVLDLTSTSITTPELAFVQDLPELRELHLGHTPINDKAFVHFAGLENLEVLVLDNTSIDGSGFQVFAKRRGFAGLRHISANHTSFGNYGFVHISGWKNLEYLSAVQSGVTDSSLAGLRRCTEMKELNLGYNSISDLGVKQLGGLKKLEKLELHNSSATITDLSFNVIKNMKQLTFLQLNGSSCTERAARLLKEKFIPGATISITAKTI